MLGDLSKSGIQITEDIEESDTVIVNTCGFVEDAKNESLEAIFEAVQMKNDGLIKKIIVTGCLAQRYSLLSVYAVRK